MYGIGRWKREIVSKDIWICTWAKSSCNIFTLLGSSKTGVTIPSTSSTQGGILLSTIDTKRRPFHGTDYIPRDSCAAGITEAACKLPFVRNAAASFAFERGKVDLFSMCGVHCHHKVFRWTLVLGAGVGLAAS